MISTRFVRDNIDAIKESLERRKSDYPIDELLELDKGWRAMQTELQELQHKRNVASEGIAKAKKEGKEVSETISEMAGIKERINGLEVKIAGDETRINYLLWNLPNVLDKSVPFGKDDSENIEIRKWGKEGKRIETGHSEFLEKMDMLDVERAAKIAGSRFYFMKGDLVLLEQALVRFATDFLYSKGYIPVVPPHLMKERYYRGVTGLGDFEDALYVATDTKESEGLNSNEHIEELMFMISTSEHPMAAMHADEVFSPKDLPIKYAGISQCFRREAGAHGKDTKGIFRVHQFEKVEQFVFCRQEDSEAMYKELVANEEEIWQKLNIPYHVVNICTGDIGVVAAKKYDIEGWFPSQGKYRELTSCSNCTDWQSMRLNISYDEKGERKYVHTLNATGVSVQRALVAIVENYLNSDNTITVPEVLVPYIGKKVLGKK